MQDRYAFDIGDFSKLGLMRRLHSADHTRRLGLIWYANSPVGREAVNGDGKHIRYLCPLDQNPTTRALRLFRSCDPELYDSMRTAMRTGQPRTIAELERLAVWPAGTTWHRAPVPQDAIEREKWFTFALSAVAGSALAVCDPDNGIAWDTLGRPVSTSPKHILPDEIAGILLSGMSAVLYHHGDRSAPHDEQGRRHAAELRRRHPGLGKVIPLRFRRGTSRLYLVLAQPEHVEWIEKAMGDMSAGPWCDHGHFEIIS